MIGGTGEYNHFNLLLPGRLRAELPERRQQVLFQGVVQGGQLGGHLLQAGLLQQRSQGRDGGEKGTKEQPKKYRNTHSKSSYPNCKFFYVFRCNLNVILEHFRDLEEKWDPISVMARISATQADRWVQSLDSLQLQFWPT